MKKSILYLLIISYSIGSTGISELFKLNHFIEHYQETKQTNQSLSIFDFVAMHYLTDDNNSMDDGKDKELPFKSNLPCFNQLLVTTVNQPLIQNFSKLNYEVQVELIAPSTLPISISHSGHVWHPPKLS